ncbi:hypothetical protein GN244_ATG17791 [Phytophthora infestans]|uniref:Uncharacterized protein n=1 Tax=Phytophthora infestans TaxID=4787 RepID=A0A833SGM5_PHYIN|nr:hypothetical protein GN244_ATG17791 [Phytophthora infestans]
MIPPVKKELAAMVAIAPTPSTQRQRAADNQKPPQLSDNQLNTALEITQQPPETWYKDQYGRKATFELKVKRTAMLCGNCVEQRVLTVQLLYESGKVVEKQEILHVMSGQCLDKNRQSTLAIRIAEVSKNHLNQVTGENIAQLTLFRVEIAVPQCVTGCDYDASVVSDPVLVLSKKKKRPVKQNAETEVSSANTKKVKRAPAQHTPKRKMSNTSPESSQSSTTTITSNVAAAIAEMEESIPLRAADTTAPFTPTTPNLCLWANAAFDLLSKLQWQRIPTSATEKPGANLDEILAQALSKAYKCPSCGETYGKIPKHRDDCDLKLLLEQGKPEVSTTETAPNLSAPYSLQWSSDKHTQWPDRQRPMYSGGELTPKKQASPSNNSHELSGCASEDTQTPADDLSFAAAAASFSIHTWKDYASISKLLYRFVVDCMLTIITSSRSCAVDGGTTSGRHTLTRLSSLPSSLKNQQAETQQSQRFSALLAATKDMSADAADLFRESEAALHGDGSIVSSMNSMNLSDFFRPSPGDKDPQPRHGPISLSALLPSDQLRNPEQGVQIIMAYDFQGCGLPAFDASFNLVGFYHVLTETHNTPAELRFGPHLFPLPDEMLQELKNTSAEWKHDSSICRQRGSTQVNAEDSLALLKREVLQQVTGK